MIVIIPARYASTRLPGKPLADVAGKPLIQRVHDCAKKSGAAQIVVATDDERIRAAAEGFGASVVMTSIEHRSGTDRLAEVITKLGIGAEEIVVNLQGDEPMMPPELIRAVAAKLASHKEAQVATASHAIHERETLTNPNVVKVVCDAKGYALYFSRAAIPWPRDIMAGKGGGSLQAFRHIGLYAYRAGFVQRYASWTPCPPEETEQLEQLRVLWHGERIVVHEARALPEAGVDTPEDLERVQKIFLNRRDSQD
ncbi:MAG: 3-deoxy-manno-octulosonate cytidylyltransferase [Sulfuricaulis sp.]|nr:3-deoxy-manno-octulosonate cytidylyltransferase [Sulfuricaulis sp.]MCR4345903.1 3-deoxy-manno-octulosonate cytidylyltransferase [Sulfuricaulis sp.]